MRVTSWLPSGPGIGCAVHVVPPVECRTVPMVPTTYTFVAAVPHTAMSGLVTPLTSFVQLLPSVVRAIAPLLAATYSVFGATDAMAWNDASTPVCSGVQVPP